MITHAVLNISDGKRAILEDDQNSFFQHLSFADLEIRMLRSFRNESLAKALKVYQNFIQNEVIEFDQAEKERIEHCFGKINQMLGDLNIPFNPSEIQLVKTTGREEGGCGYTRNNTVFIPANYFMRDDFRLLAFFTHEIFHIFSRFNPGTKPELYEAIGFTAVPGLKISTSLKEIKINNPDAADCKYKIELAGKAYAPFIISKPYSGRFTAKQQMFDFLFPAYFQIENNEIDKDRFEVFPRIKGAYEVIVENEIGTYTTHKLYDNITYNTGYIIHPEEIMADNFSMLLLSSQYDFVQNVLDPKGKALQDKIRQILVK